MGDEVPHLVSSDEEEELEYRPRLTADEDKDTDTPQRGKEPTGATWHCIDAKCAFR